MFGRSPRLTVDIAFVLEVEGNPIGRRKFLCNVLCRPSPFSRWTAYTGMSLLGWLTILYGSSSHLSVILCFPSKATILTSTLYHTMGNGMTERFNRTLLNILGTLDFNQKKDWKSHVAGLVRLCSLVSCWNSYGIPCGMVGYDKDVLIESCKPKLHIYNNKTKSQYKYTCNIRIHINTIHIFVLKVALLLTASNYLFTFTNVTAISQFQIKPPLFWSHVSNIWVSERRECIVFNSVISRS
jgi:hypothetical protein